MPFTFYDTASYLDFRRVTWKALLASVVALAATSGCNRKRGTAASPLPSASGGRTNASAAEREKAREYCELLHVVPATRKAACCGAATELGLAAICEVEVGAALTRGAHLDRERLSACRRAMEQATRGCDWVVPWSSALPAECEGVLAGVHGEGDACASSLECREPLHCERSTQNGLGKCRAPAPAGEACGAAVDALANYTRQGPSERKHPPCRERCLFLEHRCGEASELGAKCFSSANCSEPQRCVEGKCALAATGKAFESCKSGCSEGLRCIEGQCRPRRATGERCENDLDCGEGGCVDAASGRVCGMKCSASLSALRSSAAPTLELLQRAHVKQSP